MSHLNSQLTTLLRSSKVALENRDRMRKSGVDSLKCNHCDLVIP